MTYFLLKGLHYTGRFVSVHADELITRLDEDVRTLSRFPVTVSLALLSVPKEQDWSLSKKYKQVSCEPMFFKKMAEGSLGRTQLIHDRLHGQWSIALRSIIDQDIRLDLLPHCRCHQLHGLGSHLG